MIKAAMGVLNMCFMFGSEHPKKLAVGIAHIAGGVVAIESHKERCRSVKTSRVDRYSNMISGVATHSANDTSHKVYLQKKEVLPSIRVPHNPGYHVKDPDDPLAVEFWYVMTSTDKSKCNMHMKFVDHWVGDVKVQVPIMENPRAVQQNDYLVVYRPDLVDPLKAPAGTQGSKGSGSKGSKGPGKSGRTSNGAGKGPGTKRKRT